MATLQHKNPYPRCHEIYTFGIPCLSHHNYAFTLSESFPRVYETILKEIMQFHIMTNMAMPYIAKNPCPRGHKIYNFGRPFLGHHTCIPIFVCCLSSISIRKIFLKK